MKIANEVSNNSSSPRVNPRSSCGLAGVRLQLAVPPVQYERGIVEGWFLWWLRGSVVYGGFSQTPWVRVPQLPVFRFSPFSPSRLNST